MLGGPANNAVLGIGLAPTPVSPRSESPPAQKAVAASRERFLTDESPEPRTVRDTILASWRRSHDLHVAADKIEMPFEPDAHLDTRLSRSAEPVLRSLQRAAAGPVGERHPHRPGRAGAQPAHRRRRARAPPGPGPARPGLQLRREVRRHQRHRHRPGGRRPGSRLRPRALRREPRGPGLRRRADPPPDLRPAGRRRRPHLLAQGRRAAAADPGQDHRRADPAGAARRCGRVTARPLPGVPPDLQPQDGHRVRPEQRRGHVERPRSCGARARRPGGPARPGDRGTRAGTSRHGRGRAARRVRRRGCTADPSAARTWPPASWRT